MTNQIDKTKYEPQEVMDFLCDLSQQLLNWSWEGVAGYEAIVERAGQVYGYDDTTVNMEAQVAAIKLGGLTSFVKCGIPGFPPLAHTQDLKNILADIYEGKLTIAEARKALKSLHEKKPPYSPLLVWIGAILISTSFAVDIIGTWEGVIWAGITAMATGLVFLAADRIPGFGKVAQLVATMLSGIIVMFAWKYGLTEAAPGLLLISSTFIFLPGDSISTQAFELAEGKWSAGVDRLAYSIMTLALMVTGALVATLVTNISIDELFPTGPHDAFSWWAAYPGHVVMLLGIMLTFQMNIKHFLPALLVLEIITGVAQIVTISHGEIVGTFIAMMVGTVISLFIARKPRAVPSFVLVIPVIFALSPGSHGLRMFETWLSKDQITGVQDLTTLGGILLAIAIGMVIGVIIANRWTWMKNFKTA